MINLELIYNVFNNLKLNNISCYSISYMIDKLLTISIDKLLINDDCKYMSLQLINLIFNKFIFVKKHSMSEKDVNIIINSMKSFQRFIESMDLSKMNQDIFIIQIIKFITKSLKLCPKQYLNNKYLPSAINVLLCTFATNITLSTIYPKYKRYCSNIKTSSTHYK